MEAIAWARDYMRECEDDNGEMKDVAMIEQEYNGIDLIRETLYEEDGSVTKENLY